MNQFLQKFVTLEREISREKGAFLLFALFLREDSQDKWDLVVSAKWINENMKNSLSYLSDRIRSSLTEDELLSFSRIVLVEKSHHVLDAITRAVSTKHNIAEFKDSDFFGLNIKHAFIITSSKTNEVENTKVI